MSNSARTNGDDADLFRMEEGVCNPYGFNARLVGQMCSDFLEEIVDDYKGSTLFVYGFTPEGATGIDHGAMVLEVRRDQSMVCIGFNFGATDAAGHPIRQGFDIESWRRAPLDWRSAGIWLINWEEAWAFMVAVGKYLEVRRTSICFGNYPQAGMMRIM